MRPSPGGPLFGLPRRGTGPSSAVDQAQRPTEAPLSTWSCYPMPQETLQVYSGLPWAERREQEASSLIVRVTRRGRRIGRCCPRTPAITAQTLCLLFTKSKPGAQELGIWGLSLTAPHSQVWLWFVLASAWSCKVGAGGRKCPRSHPLRLQRDRE